MKYSNVELMPNLTKKVVEDITGFKLCSYLVALEGWRRGLKLTWYKDESDLCTLHRAGGGTQGKFFSLSSDEKTHYFFRSRGDKVTNEAVNICQKKEKTKDLMNQKGVPVPQGEIFHIDDEEILNYAEKIGFPIIIKPTNGSMGRGVYTNISSVEELKNAIKDFKKRYKYKSIILEKHYHGQEYRIYVVGDKVVGATNRVPANIEGDGTHTVQELIDLKNEKRKENPYLKPKPIKIDYEIRTALKNNGLTKDSILPEGKQLFLREISNLSAGGDPIEATEDLSPEVKQIAVEALKALPSIPHAGVDIIVNPEDNKKGVVLEVNATAEISFHMFPWEGKAKDIPGAIIDYYFPETVNTEKSLAYFDYHSAIQPLISWATEEVTITESPKEKMYGKQFNIKGKVQKVGYMTYIRRQALRRGFHGYSNKIGNNEIEMIVLGSNQKLLDEFTDVCYKGSKKSKVNSVETQNFEVGKSPYKLGFEIITE